ncbi:MAG: VanW family protein [Bacteroidales bacterium]|nr:VanW family protein [Bacteroidales bacterium]
MKKEAKYKPKKRAKLRLILGKQYFTFRRKLLWLKLRKFFAKEKADVLEFDVFQHKSLLIRPLKDVDLWLQHNKVHNLSLAIKKIDSIIIKPGETFSFWYLVGKTGKNKGYKKGMNLENGKVVARYGGGICQLGNLIYWMVLHSELTVKERWRHSYDVFPDVNRTLPFGSGATLSYNYIDLQFENNTNKVFQIKLWLDDKFLNGKILSNITVENNYKVYEDKHIIKNEFWGGYTRHNSILRDTINRKGEIIKTEIVTNNHAIMMYNPMLESGGK